MLNVALIGDGYIADGKNVLNQSKTLLIWHYSAEKIYSVPSGIKSIEQKAFYNNKIGLEHFASVSGYGHDDMGREALDKVFANAFGAEAVRYYLVRDPMTGYDSDFDPERMKMIYNTELANDIGNLCNRSLNMCVRYCGGTVTIAEGDDELSAALRESMTATVAKFSDCMNAYNTADALAALNAHVGLCNSYIEQKQPWALAKDEEKLPELQRVLAHLLECCAQVGYLLGCVLPEASARILSQLQLDSAGLTPQALSWGLVKDDHTVQAPSPVFPRILSAEEKEKMAAKAAKAAEKAARKAAQQG